MAAERPWTGEGRRAGRPASQLATAPTGDAVGPAGQPADGAAGQRAGEVAGDKGAPVDQIAGKPTGERADDPECALPDSLPQNIVIFPVPSVIIPFPLAEAKAMGTVANGVRSVVAGEAGGDSEVGVALNLQRPTFNVPVSTPGNDVVSSLTNESSDSSKGMDVSRLGLTPVEESDRPENVHPVEFAKAAAEECAAPKAPVIIPFPVAQAKAMGGVPAGQQAGGSAGPQVVEPRAQTQLPGERVVSEKSALSAGVSAPAMQVASNGRRPMKAAVRAGSPLPPAPATSPSEATGISAARQERRMDTLWNSEAAARQADGALNSAKATPDVVASPSDSAHISRDEADTLNFAARNLTATDWQSGRPVSSSDRLASDSLMAGTVDTTGKVERIAKLLSGEVALVKQHSSDSMAVVLRPDAETELFVHLTQRNGQIEATVRCERGDLQHLGALWGQLQESLAQQKVRLAPLQESPSHHSNFNQPTGSDANGHGHGSPPHSQHEEPTPSEKQSMDEWPTPASSGTDSAHVRGRGGSRHRRLTTSRPGWETWA